jgi:hypothetical protein
LLTKESINKLRQRSLRRVRLRRPFNFSHNLKSLIRLKDTSGWEEDRIPNRPFQQFIYNRPSGQRLMATGSKLANFTLLAKTIREPSIYIWNKIIYRVWSKYAESLKNKVISRYYLTVPKYSKKINSTVMQRKFTWKWGTWNR